MNCIVIISDRLMNIVICIDLVSNGNSPTPTFYPTCDPLSNDKQTWLPHVPYEIWMHVMLHKRQIPLKTPRGIFVNLSTDELINDL